MQPPQNPSDTITINLVAPKWWIKVMGALITVIVGGGIYIINSKLQDVSNGFTNASAEVARVQTSLDKALGSFDSVKTSLQDQRVSIAFLEHDY